MKNLKHVFVFLLIGVGTGLLFNSFGPDHPLHLIIILSILSFLILNLILRKSLSFKNYFISNYNLLTTKVWSEKVYDIPKELLFEKIIEVINSSDFKLADTDKVGLEILAISTMTFKSWGENLYLSFETRGTETIMKVCSATFFQAYDWGKNEKNCEVLLNEIESSLTV